MDFATEEKLFRWLRMIDGSFGDDEEEIAEQKKARDWATGDFVYLVKDPARWWFVQDDGSDPGKDLGTVYLINENSQTNIYYPYHCRKWPGPEPIVTPWLQGVVDKYRSNASKQHHVTRCVDSDGPVSQHACCKQKE
jgi:hypothetical protein